MSWQEKTIDQLGKVITGKTPPTKNRAMYDGDYMFVTPTDLDWQSYYVRNTHSTVTELARDRHKNQFIPANTIVFTCIGNTIGKCGLASADCLSNQQINSVVVNEEHDPKFVYYLLNHSRAKIRSIGLSCGAAQPIINKSTFSSIKVSVPETKLEQERISSVLSAYDDLIENNQRRVALLEETARLLYREWFVHFRFPGHEQVKIIDGVPENFDVLELANFCKLRGGNAFKTKFQGKPSGDYPFIKVGDMNSAGNSVSITEANNWVSEMEAKAIKAKAFPPGTVVFAKIGEALKQNRVRLISRNTLIDNNMMGAVPDEESISPVLLYCLLSDYDIASHASGAAVPFLTATVLSQLKFPIPNKTLRTEFERIVVPILKQVANLQIQITTTAKARDLLLPRLMDGRLEV